MSALVPMQVSGRCQPSVRVPGAYPSSPTHSGPRGSGTYGMGLHAGPQVRQPLPSARGGIWDKRRRPHMQENMWHGRRFCGSSPVRRPAADSPRRAVVMRFWARQVGLHSVKVPDRRRRGGAGAGWIGRRGSSAVPLPVVARRCVM